MNDTARIDIGFMKKRPFKVIVCLVTLVAFLFNIMSYDLAWAARTPSGFPGGSPVRARGPVSSEKPVSTKELRADTFTLPEYLGRIKDSWSSPRSAHDSPLSATRRDSPDLGKTTVPGQSLIIHIQDAHSNYACQQQIAKIIEYVNKEYGVDTINLEGGAREYDLSIFTNIADKALRDKASDYFVKEGIVNGAEYFAVNNPEKVTLWGIEDTKLYIDNLSIYRNSLKHKEEVDKMLRSLSYILANLKIKIYSKELLDFDMNYGAYKAGNMEFKEYLSYLINTASSLREASPKAGDEAIPSSINIDKMPNITLLSQVLGEEGDIGFRKANNQRDELIDSLQKRLSRDYLKELVLKTVEFKQERISQKEFYAYLSARAKQFGADMAKYPDLEKYIAYISTYDAIDKVKVMEEMDALEDAVRNSMLRNDTERELSLLSKNFAILKNIFNISLTKDDYKYYLANKESFNISNFTSFITRCGKGLSPDGNLTEAGTVPDIVSLDRYRDEIAKFYDYSLKRDGAFLKNIRFTNHDSRMTIHKPRTSLLITGGFHTENLAELFRKQGISYISIMPNFKNNKGYECPYLRLLAGNKSIEDMKIRGIMSANAIAIASIFSLLGRSIDGKEAVVETAIKVHMAIARIRGLAGIKIVKGDAVRYYDLEWNPVDGKSGEFETVLWQLQTGLALPVPGPDVTPLLPPAAPAVEIPKPSQEASDMAVDKHIKPVVSPPQIIAHEGEPSAIKLGSLVAFLVANEDGLNKIVETLKGGGNLQEVIDRKPGQRDHYHKQIEHFTYKQFVHSLGRPLVEYASNAIDAMKGVSENPEVDIEVDEDGIVVSDKGTGMDEKVIFSDLLIPAMSRKKDAIGRFGVGFYSGFEYLRNEGDRIIVNTATKTSSYKLIFTRQGGTTLIAIEAGRPDGKKTGTVIRVETKFSKKEVGDIVKTAAGYMEFNKNAAIHINGSAVNGAEGLKVVQEEGPDGKENPVRFMYSSDNEAQGKGEVVVTLNGMTLNRYETKGYHIPKLVVVEYPKNLEIAVKRDLPDWNDKTMAASQRLLELMMADENRFALVAAFSSIVDAYKKAIGDFRREGSPGQMLYDAYNELRRYAARTYGDKVIYLPDEKIFNLIDLSGIEKEKGKIIFMPRSFTGDIRLGNIFKPYPDFIMPDGSRQRIFLARFKNPEIASYQYFNGIFYNEKNEPKTETEKAAFAESIRTLGVDGRFGYEASKKDRIQSARNWLRAFIDKIHPRQLALEFAMRESVVQADRKARKRSHWPFTASFLIWNLAYMSMAVLLYSISPYGRIDHALCALLIWGAAILAPSIKYHTDFVNYERAVPRLPTLASIAVLLMAAIHIAPASAFSPLIELLLINWITPIIFTLFVLNVPNIVYSLIFYIMVKSSDVSFRLTAKDSDKKLIDEGYAEFLGSHPYSADVKKDQGAFFAMQFISKLSETGEGRAVLNDPEYRQALVTMISEIIKYVAFERADDFFAGRHVSGARALNIYGDKLPELIKILSENSKDAKLLPMILLGTDRILAKFNVAGRSRRELADRLIVMWKYFVDNNAQRSEDEEGVFSYLAAQSGFDYAESVEDTYYLARPGLFYLLGEKDSMSEAETYDPYEPFEIQESEYSVRNLNLSELIGYYLSLNDGVPVLNPDDKDLPQDEEFKKRLNSTDPSESIKATSLILKSLAQKKQPEFRVEIAKRFINNAVEHQNPDKNIFLRELGQNVIDVAIETGADESDRVMNIKPRRYKNHLTLTFSDYFGMDLFRLFNKLIIPGESTKWGQEETIGEMGIGFLTLYKDADRVYIKTSPGNGVITLIRISDFERVDGQVFDAKISISVRAAMGEERGFKGTDIFWCKKTNTPTMDEAELHSSMIYQAGMVDSGTLSINWDDVEQNLPRMDISSASVSSPSCRGILRMRARHHENMLTKDGLIVKPSNTEYLNLLPKKVRELLSRHGIILDIPHGARLIRDRTDLERKEQVLTELTPAVQSAGLTALMRLIAMGKISYQEIFQEGLFDLKTLKQLEPSEEIAGILSDISSGKPFDQSADLFKDLNNLARLIANLPRISLRGQETRVSFLSILKGLKSRTIRYGDLTDKKAAGFIKKEIAGEKMRRFAKVATAVSIWAVGLAIFVLAAMYGPDYIVSVLSKATGAQILQDVGAAVDYKIPPQIAVLINVLSLVPTLLTLKFIQRFLFKGENMGIRVDNAAGAVIKYLRTLLPFKVRSKDFVVPITDMKDQHYPYKALAALTEKMAEDVLKGKLKGISKKALPVSCGFFWENMDDVIAHTDTDSNRISWNLAKLSGGIAETLMAPIAYKKAVRQGITKEDIPDFIYAWQQYLQNPDNLSEERRQLMKSYIFSTVADEITHIENPDLAGHNNDFLDKKRVNLELVRANSGLIDAILKRLTDAAPKDIRFATPREFFIAFGKEPQQKRSAEETTGKAALFKEKILFYAILLTIIGMPVIGYIFPLGPMEILIHEYLHAIPVIITGGSASIGLNESGYCLASLINALIPNLPGITGSFKVSSVIAAGLAQTCINPLLGPVAYAVVNFISTILPTSVFIAGGLGLMGTKKMPLKMQPFFKGLGIYLFVIAGAAGSMDAFIGGTILSSIFGYQSIGLLSGAIGAVATYVSMYIVGAALYYMWRGLAYITGAVIGAIRPFRYMAPAALQAISVRSSQGEPLDIEHDKFRGGRWPWLARLIDSGYDWLMAREWVNKIPLLSGLLVRYPDEIKNGIQVTIEHTFWIAGMIAGLTYGFDSWLSLGIVALAFGSGHIPGIDKNRGPPLILLDALLISALNVSALIIAGMVLPLSPILIIVTLVITAPFHYLYNAYVDAQAKKAQDAEPSTAAASPLSIGDRNIGKNIFTKILAIAFILGLILGLKPPSPQGLMLPFTKEPGISTVKDATVQSPIITSELKEMVKAIVTDAIKLNPDQETIVFEKGPVRISVSPASFSMKNPILYIMSDRQEASIVAIRTDPEGNLIEITGGLPLGAVSEDGAAVDLEGVKHPLIDAIKRDLKLPPVTGQMRQKEAQKAIERKKKQKDGEERGERRKKSVIITPKLREIVKAIVNDAVKRQLDKETIIFKEGPVRILFSPYSSSAEGMYLYILSDRQEVSIVAILTDPEGNIKVLSGGLPLGEVSEDGAAVDLDGREHPLIGEIERVLELPHVTKEMRQKEAQKERERREKQKRIDKKIKELEKLPHHRRGTVPDNIEANEVWQRQFGVTKYVPGKYPYIQTFGLGPCVALTLYDPLNKTGLLAHFDATTDVPASFKAMLSKLGRSNIDNLEARIIGGEAGSSEGLITEIADTAEKNGIPITEADILGMEIRCITLDPRSGEVSDYTESVTDKKPIQLDIHLLRIQRGEFAPLEFNRHSEKGAAGTVIESTPSPAPSAADMAIDKPGVSPSDTSLVPVGTMEDSYLKDATQALLSENYEALPDILNNLNREDVAAFILLEMTEIDNVSAIKIMAGLDPSLVERILFHELNICAEFKDFIKLANLSDKGYRNNVIENYPNPVRVMQLIDAIRGKNDENREEAAEILASFKDEFLEKLFGRAVEHYLAGHTTHLEVLRELLPEGKDFTGKALIQIKDLENKNKEMRAIKVIMGINENDPKGAEKIVQEQLTDYYTIRLFSHMAAKGEYDNLVKFTELAGKVKIIEIIEKLDGIKRENAIQAIVNTNARGKPKIDETLKKDILTRFDPATNNELKGLYRNIREITDKIMPWDKERLKKQDLINNLGQLSARCILLQNGLRQPGDIFSEEYVENKGAAMFLLLASGFNVRIDDNDTLNFIFEISAAEGLKRAFRLKLDPGVEISTLDKLFSILKTDPGLAKKIKGDLRLFCKARGMDMKRGALEKHAYLEINPYYTVHFSNENPDLLRMMDDRPLSVPKKVPGDIFDGRYRIISEAPEGGMCVVYKAIDTMDPSGGRECIIKILKDPGDSDRLYYEERFDVEAKVLQDLNSPAVPGVIRLYDYQNKAYKDDLTKRTRIKYMVLEYARGKTLHDWMEEKRSAGGINAAEAISIIGKLAGIVGAIHDRGVIHRDISPRNIIVGDSGEVTLIDFGLAKPSKIAVHSSDRASMGTPPWAAPEQYAEEGFPRVDKKADIYSIGAILQYMITGQVPRIWAEIDPVDFNKDLEEVIKVINMATRTEPGQRHKSAEEFIQALVEAFRNVPSLLKLGPSQIRAAPGLPMGAPTAFMSPDASGNIQALNPPQDLTARIARGFIYMAMGLSKVVSIVSNSVAGRIVVGINQKIADMPLARELGIRPEDMKDLSPIQKINHIRDASQGCYKEILSGEIRDRAGPEAVEERKALCSVLEKAYKIGIKEDPAITAPARYDKNKDIIYVHPNAYRIRSDYIFTWIIAHELGERDARFIGWRTLREIAANVLARRIYHSQLTDYSRFKDYRQMPAFDYWWKYHERFKEGVIADLPAKEYTRRLKDYAGRLEGIKSLNVDIDMQRLDPTTLFIKIQKIEGLADLVRYRSLYRREMLNDKDAEKDYDLGRLESHLEDLKNEMRRRIENDPQILAKIMRCIHDGSIPITCDSAIDWLLLGIIPEEADRVNTGDYSQENDIYEGTPYYIIRDVLEWLKVGEGDILYDLGSGYGRVVFYAALATKIKKAVGIEMVHERVEQCNKTKTGLGPLGVELRATEFIEGNAQGVDFTDGTILFMFNPFSRATLEQVVPKMEAIANDKNIRIVAWGGGSCIEYLSQQRWLKVKGRMKHGQYDVVIFESTSAPAALATAPTGLQEPVSEPERPALPVAAADMAVDIPGVGPGGVSPETEAVTSPEKLKSEADEAESKAAIKNAETRLIWRRDLPLEVLIELLDALHLSYELSLLGDAGYNNKLYTEIIVNMRKCKAPEKKNIADIINRGTWYDPALKEERIKIEEVIKGGKGAEIITAIQNTAVNDFKEKLSSPLCEAAREDPLLANSIIKTIASATTDIERKGLGRPLALSIDNDNAFIDSEGVNSLIGAIKRTKDEAVLAELGESLGAIINYQARRFSDGPYTIDKLINDANAAAEKGEGLHAFVTALHRALYSNNKLTLQAGQIDAVIELMQGLEGGHVLYIHMLSFCQAIANAGEVIRLKPDKIDILLDKIGNIKDEEIIRKFVTALNQVSVEGLATPLGAKLIRALSKIIQTTQDVKTVEQASKILVSIVTDRLSLADEEIEDIELIYRRLPETLSNGGSLLESIRSGLDVIGEKSLLTFLNAKDEGRPLEVMLLDYNHKSVFDHIGPFIGTLNEKDKKAFINEILKQVANDKGFDSNGEVSHTRLWQTVQVLNNMEGQGEDWREKILNSEINDTSLKKRRDELLKTGSGTAFNGWKQFEKLKFLANMIINKDLLEHIQKYKDGTPEGEIKYKYYHYLIGHSNMNDFNALRKMILDPASFLGLQDVHAPAQVHNGTKPSVFLDLEYIDIEAQELMDGLILGKFDHLQSLKPIPPVKIGMLEIDGNLRQLKGGELLEYLLSHSYIGANSLKQILFKYLKSLTQDVDCKKFIKELEDKKMGKETFNNVISKLRGAKFDISNLCDNGLELPVYTVQIITKSDAQAFMTGSEAPSCMQFGSGKNNVYLFNLNTGFLALSKEVIGEDGEPRQRILATSVTTADRKIPALVSELKNSVDAAAAADRLEDLDIAALMGDDFTRKISKEAFVAADNVEGAPNRIARGEFGISFDTVVKAGYKKFFEEYFKVHKTTRRERKLCRDKIPFGTAHSDFLKYIDGTEDNHYLMQTPVSYSDKTGSTVAILKLDAKEEADESIGRLHGVLPLSHEDWLEVAYIENKAFKDKPSHKTRIGGRDMELMGAEYNEALKGDRRKNLNLGYFNKEGELTGYVIAYVGYDKEQEREIIFISDFAVLDKGSPTAFRLLNELFRNIHDIAAKFRQEYSKDIKVLFQATMDADGSYRLFMPGKDETADEIRKKEQRLRRFGLEIEKQDDLRDGRTEFVCKVIASSMTPQVVEPGQAHGLSPGLSAAADMAIDIPGGMPAGSGLAEPLLMQGGRVCKYTPVQIEAMPKLNKTLDNGIDKWKYQDKIVQDDRGRHFLIKIDNDAMIEYAAFKVARTFGATVADVVIPDEANRIAIAKRFGVKPENIYLVRIAEDYSKADIEVLAETYEQAFTRNLVASMIIRKFDIHMGNVSELKDTHEPFMMFDNETAFNPRVEDIGDFTRYFILNYFSRGRPADYKIPLTGFWKIIDENELSQAISDAENIKVADLNGLCDAIKESFPSRAGEIESIFKYVKDRQSSIRADVEAFFNNIEKRRAPESAMPDRIRKAVAAPAPESEKPLSSSNALKVPSSTNEDTEVDKAYREGLKLKAQSSKLILKDGARGLILEAIKNTSGERAPPLDTMPDVEIHTIDIRALKTSGTVPTSGKPQAGDSPLPGIPKFEGATAITDLIPALGEYKDGILHIYVTQKFYENVLTKGTVPTSMDSTVRGQSLLAELIDHGYAEHVLYKIRPDLVGKTASGEPLTPHQFAAQRARFFAEPGSLSPYHEWILGQINDAKFLNNLMKEDRSWVTDKDQKAYEELFLAAAASTAATILSGAPASFSLDTRDRLAQLGLPDETTDRLLKDISKLEAEDADRADNILSYLIDVYAAAKDVIGKYPCNVSEERNIIIPVSKKFMPVKVGTGDKYLTQIKVALEHALTGNGNGFNVNIWFYNGEAKGLEDIINEKNEEKAKENKKLNNINTIAFIDHSIGADKIDKEKIGITVFPIRAPEKGIGYISMGGFIALGLGILAMVERKWEDDDYRLYIAKLIGALGKDASLAELKGVELENFISELKKANIVITLPPVEQIDLDANMERHVIMEKALATAL